MIKTTDVSQTEVLLIALLGYPSLAIIGEFLKIGDNIVLKSLSHIIFIATLFIVILSKKQSLDISKASSIIKLLSTIIILRLAYNGIILKETVYKDEQLYVACIEIILSIFCFYQWQYVKDKEYGYLVYLFAITLFLAIIKAADFQVSAEENFSGRAALNRLDPISLAMYSISCFVFSTSMLISKKKLLIIPKLLSCFVILCSIYLIVISGSRGPLIFLTIATLFLFQRLKVNYGTIVANSVAAICAFIFAGTIFLASANGYLFALNRAGNSVNEGDLRAQFASNGFELIKDNPIFGSGVFVPEIMNLSEKFYSHSIIVDVFLHFGIPIGSMVLLYFLMSIYGLSRRCLTASDGEFPVCLSCLVYLLLCFTSSQLIWSPTTLCFFFFGLHSFFINRFRTSLQFEGMVCRG